MVMHSQLLVTLLISALCIGCSPYDTQQLLVTKGDYKVDISLKDSVDPGRPVVVRVWDDKGEMILGKAVGIFGGSGDFVEEFKMYEDMRVGPVGVYDVAKPMELLLCVDTKHGTATSTYGSELATLCTKTLSKVTGNTLIFRRGLVLDW